MFNKMPTAVEVGADRPIIVRLALGWILIIYAMGRRTSRVCTSPCTMDPEGFVGAIEVTYHAEQDGSGDGLGRKALEVGIAVGDNRGICRSQTGENVALAPHQCKDDAADHMTDAIAVDYGQLCAFYISSTHVL